MADKADKVLCNAICKGNCPASRPDIAKTFCKTLLLAKQQLGEQVCERTCQMLDGLIMFAQISKSQTEIIDKLVECKTNLKAGLTKEETKNAKQS